MKKIIVLFFVFMFLTFTNVYAGPFLVCTPVPKADLTHYQISEDNGVNWTNFSPQDLNDDTVRLRADLSECPNGSYTWHVRAVNQWGHSDSVPFSFTKALPATPSAVEISLE